MRDLEGKKTLSGMSWLSGKLDISAPACPICLEEVRNWQWMARISACHHTYHHGCLDAVSSIMCGWICILTDFLTIVDV